MPNSDVKNVGGLKNESDVLADSQTGQPLCLSVLLLVGNQKEFLLQKRGVHNTILDYLFRKHGLKPTLKSYDYVINLEDSRENGY